MDTGHGVTVRGTKQRSHTDQASQGGKYFKGFLQMLNLDFYLQIDTKCNLNIFYKVNCLEEVL